MEKSKVNLKYKDRLFRLLFGSMEYKDNILDLYNALNGTDYDNPDELELSTIDDVIYIRMKNDVAFILDSCLSLWEQQSSYNPNMPLRGLMYFAKIYDRYIESNGLNIYGSRKVMIPTPKYVVFYNGNADRPSVERLRLSDSFMRLDCSGDFEWTATVYNLNTGKNDMLLKKCRPLGGYMELINRINDNGRTDSIEDAVNRAVDSCIREGILSGFLTAHRAEVLDMCITEFNEKSFIEGIKEEGRSEGRDEGIIQSIKTFMLNGGTEEMAKRLLNATDEQILLAKK